MKANISGFALALLPVLVCALHSCASPSCEWVAGSAHIETVLRDLSGGHIKVHNLIPPSACPGHCDMRPSDVAAVAGCKALFIHPWQRNMANVQGVIESSKVEESRIHVVDVPGNWMAPPVQAQAVSAIADVLAQIEPERAPEYAERAQKRVASIHAFGEEQIARLNEVNVAGTKVLCAEILAPFVKWAGFDVAGTFGRAEDSSVADMETLIRDGREQKVALIIDNLQSGDTKTGATLAAELGASHVVLSNFPGGFENTETWEKALQRNVDLLLEGARPAHG